MYKIIGKHKISPIVGDEIDLLNLSAKDISIIENDDLLYAYNEISKADGDFSLALFWNCNYFYKNDDSNLVKLYGNDGIISFRNMMFWFNAAKRQWDKFK